MSAPGKTDSSLDFFLLVNIISPGSVTDFKLFGNGLITLMVSNNYFSKITTGILSMM